MMTGQLYSQRICTLMLPGPRARLVSCKTSPSVVTLFVCGLLVTGMCGRCCLALSSGRASLLAAKTPCCHHSRRHTSLRLPCQERSQRWGPTNATALPVHMSSCINGLGGASCINQFSGVGLCALLCCSNSIQSSCRCTQCLLADIECVHACRCCQTLDTRCYSRKVWTCCSCCRTRASMPRSVPSPQHLPKMEVRAWAQQDQWSSPPCR